MEVDGYTQALEARRVLVFEAQLGVGQQEAEPRNIGESQVCSLTVTLAGQPPQYRSAIRNGIGPLSNSDFVVDVGVDHVSQLARESQKIRGGHSLNNRVPRRSRRQMTRRNRCYRESNEVERLVSRGERSRTVDRDQ